ncbi:MAG: ATP-dependent zinc protease family protein [Lentisphaeria bacterium]
MKRFFFIALSSTLMSCNTLHSINNNNEVNNSASLQSTDNNNPVNTIISTPLEETQPIASVEEIIPVSSIIDDANDHGSDEETTFVASEQNNTLKETEKSVTNNDAIPPLPVEVAAPVRQIILGDLIVAGFIEQISLHNGTILCQAKLDTGADNSSIGASDIVEFEKDGKKWVRFNIEFTAETLKMSLPIKKITRIKRHNAESQTRIVVELDAKLGDIHQRVDFSLTSREKFNYPVLLGRNFLNGKFLVDSSRTFIITEEK